MNPVGKTKGALNKNTNSRKFTAWRECLGRKKKKGSVGTVTCMSKQSGVIGPNSLLKVIGPNSALVLYVAVASTGKCY